MARRTLKEIGDVPISSEDLTSFMAALTKSVKRGAAFDPHAELKRMHPGNPNKVLAILCRMTAFSQLDVSDFRGFGYESESGVFDMVSFATIHAAAECPLRGERHPYFNATEFHGLCLKHADIEGSS